MKKLVIIFFTWLIISVPFLPYILSTRITKPLFEKAFAKKFKASIQIDRVKLSWLGPQTFTGIAFSHSDTFGIIESLESEVPFWSISQLGSRCMLRNGQFSFPRYGDLQIRQVQAKITEKELSASGEATQGGSFFLKGEINSSANFHLGLQCSQMPSALFDPLTTIKGIVPAFLGPSFNLSSDLAYNYGEGQIKADLSSPTTTCSLQGKISKDCLVLTQPFLAKLIFTPELSKISNGFVLNAKNPITLEISPEGSFLPFTPFSLKKMTFSHARVTLGQIVTAELHPLLSLFSLLGKGSILPSNPTIWFTPIDLSLNEGILAVSRFDALISRSIHLCGWGQFLILKNNLSGFIGIPADTLEQTLGLSNLPSKFVLKIPLRGPLWKPSLDIGPASAKIAALAATNQISTKLKKKIGPLGNVLNSIPSPEVIDPSVPPPKRPFPWE